MASNPSIVTCTKDTWVKVATNVIAGTIHIKSTAPDKYYHTYRLTSGAAPTDLTDAIEFESKKEDISASAAIDVYIYAQNKEGSVRVDLI